MENTQLNDIRLSQHFKLTEFLNLEKHPDNLPSVQVLFNLKYGCQYLLEPARREVGAIIVNSGYRNSQHLLGQAADIRPKDPRQFQRLVDFLRTCDYTDQLLTGPGWLHISWTPFASPRHLVRLGYYK